MLDVLAPEALSNARKLAIVRKRTPTLQHITWKHPDLGALPSSALALRSLHVDDVQGGAILDALGCACVTAAAPEALAHMHREALCRLEISSFKGARARHSAIPPLSLAARARCRLLARASARHACARVSGASVEPIHRLSVCADSMCAYRGSKASGSSCLRHAACRSFGILRAPR